MTYTSACINPVHSESLTCNCQLNRPALKKKVFCLFAMRINPSPSFVFVSNYNLQGKVSAAAAKTVLVKAEEGRGSS